MISAIVLAAGESKRMGWPKMLLPWGQTTVIGKVVKTLEEGGVSDIRVVTGGARIEVEKALYDSAVKFIFNQDYAGGEMLKSAQLGLSALVKDVSAALIVLGDQPQIELPVVTTILERYATTGHTIIVPSFQMHRGHPWLIEQSLWPEILELRPPDTLRDFLAKHNHEIDYIDVETSSVIQDLDTKNDYLKYKP
jgi:molybdenum cofactor cytidylyltransferase